jgi:hypothetical protein
MNQWLQDLIGFLGTTDNKQADRRRYMTYRWPATRFQEAYVRASLGDFQLSRLYEDEKEQIHAVTVLAEEETAEFRIAQLETYLRTVLDRSCQDRGYDSYQSALNWASFANPYQTHAHILADWVAACWERHFGVLQEINSHARPIPEKTEYLSLLPAVPEM